ncbi:MAG: zinc ribbon domain-containing protein [Acidobacteria bacterium]|nr:zinc ribbon domain-containing protein [Acidobacteriota bacterium]
MFCPKCGTENADAASFCRGCGSNIALVPQALTGTLRDPLAVDESRLSRRERRELMRERLRERKRKKPASIESAVVPFFGGIGFVLVALAIMFFMPAGYMWGFWMFIPAFFMIGAGLSEYLRWKQQQGQTQQQFPAYAPPNAIPSARPTETLPPAHATTAAMPRRTTDELYAPPSVTEGTTKLLDRDQ